MQDQINDYRRITKTPNFDEAEDKSYVARMSQIDSLSITSRSLLYTYNKNKLKNFMEARENLLIIEQFLALANEIDANTITTP